MDDDGDVVDVNSASGDVRRNKCVGDSGRERRQVARTFGLRQVTVQFDGRNAGLHQLLCEAAGAVLRAGEDHRATRRCTQVGDDRNSVVVVDMQDVVGHGLCGNLGLIDFVCGRVVKELAHQLVDAAVESGREQQSLSVLGSLRKNLADVFEEAELCHVVCFVQNSDLDVVERHVT